MIVCILWSKAWLSLSTTSDLSRSICTEHRAPRADIHTGAHTTGRHTYMYRYTYSTTIHQYRYAVHRVRPLYLLFLPLGLDVGLFLRLPGVHHWPGGLHLKGNIANYFDGTQKRWPQLASASQAAGCRGRSAMSDQRTSLRCSS